MFRIYFIVAIEIHIILLLQYLVTQEKLIVYDLQTTFIIIYLSELRRDIISILNIKYRYTYTRHLTMTVATLYISLSASSIQCDTYIIV